MEIPFARNVTSILNFNLYLRLYDVDGNLVEEQNSSNTGIGGTMTVDNILSDGVYTLWVFEREKNQIGTYHLF